MVEERPGAGGAAGQTPARRHRLQPRQVADQRDPRAGPEAAEIDAALAEALKTMRLKDAATAVAGALGLPRREVYQRALALGRD